MAEKTEPNFGVETANAEVNENRSISYAELQEILAERDRKHAEEMAEVRAQVPVAMVPMHSGGPGVDNHQKSWSLVEQEAAARGEVLDHWV